MRQVFVKTLALSASRRSLVPHHGTFTYNRSTSKHSKAECTNNCIPVDNCLSNAGLQVNSYLYTHIHNQFKSQ